MDMNFTLSTTGEEGLTLLKQVKVFRPDTPVILMTAWGSIQLAVQGMQAGAFDFIPKPWNNAALLQRIETALELSTAPKETTQEQNDAFNRNHIIGRSQGLTDVLNTIARIAPLPGCIPASLFFHSEFSVCLFQPIPDVSIVDRPYCSE